MFTGLYIQTYYITFSKYTCETLISQRPLLTLRHLAIRNSFSSDYHIILQHKWLQQQRAYEPFGYIYVTGRVHNPSVTLASISLDRTQLRDNNF